MATFIIGTIVIGSMILVGIKQIKNIKKGENACGCRCSGCSSKDSCHGINVKK